MATMSLVNTDKQAVDAIRSQKQQSNHNRESRKQTTKPSTQNNQWGNCGKVHGKNKKLCPAYGKRCRHWHKLNHFQLMCRSKVVHDIDTAEENSDYYGARGCDNSFS